MYIRGIEIILTPCYVLCHLLFLSDLSKLPVWNVLFYFVGDSSQFYGFNQKTILKFFFVLTHEEHVGKFDESQLRNLTRHLKKNEQHVFSLFDKTLAYRNVQKYRPNSNVM